MSETPADPSNAESKALAPKGMVMDPDAQIPREIISTAGNAFTCGQEKLGTEMDLVILASARTRMFFENAYKPGVEQFPACYAVGASLSPSINAPKPQSEFCETCPLSQWDGRKPPKCQERRKLVGIRVVTKDVPVLKDDSTPAHHGDGRPMTKKVREPNIKLTVLSVFPTSVNASKDNAHAIRPYLATLSPKGYAKEDVITHVKMESNAPKPGAKMIFTMNGTVEDVTGLPPALLVGFKGAAIEESLYEPKPREDEEANDEKEVKETAAENAKPKREKKEAKY